MEYCRRCIRTEGGEIGQAVAKVKGGEAKYDDFSCKLTDILISDDTLLFFYEKIGVLYVPL